MAVDTREPQAFESYATFWLPDAGASPAQEPAGELPPHDAPKARDAYAEFVNSTEAAPGTQPAARS